MENAERIEQELNTTATSSQKSTMLRGTAWLTLTDILSRVLGAVYIIPWYAWMGKNGDQANAMFSMGYNIYALFLLISTAGIPVAVSREVARYHALGDEALSHRLVRQMFLFMIGLGAVSALIMYLLSPVFASLSGGGGNAAQLTPVMQSLALSIFVFPAMAVIRGYFQGLNEMKPIALSQIYEQLVRVIWMLVLTFMIMKLGFSNGNWAEAVVQSTFAAFIGMIASVAILLYYLMKSHLLRDIVRPQKSQHKISAGKLLGRTLWQAIPFIVIGSAIQIFKIIDQMTFSTGMHWVTNFTDTQLSIYFAYFSANTDKLTMILIGEAMTLGAVALPLITSNFVKKNYKETAHLISYNYQLFVAFMLPAVVGMVLLSVPLYTVFYTKPSGLALALFIFAVIQSFLLGLYTMVAPILQALHYSRMAMKFFIRMLLVKLLLQFPAIIVFHSYGPLIATSLAFILGCFLVIRQIARVSKLKGRSTWRGIVGIAILSFLMLLVTLILFLLVSVLLSFIKDLRIRSLLIVFFAGGGGFFSYLYLAAQTGLLDKLLGERAKGIRRRLHI